jgi:hypothetical protein
MTSRKQIALISAIALIAAASWMGWNAMSRGPDSTGAVAANGQETVGSSDEEANEVLAQEPAPASSGRVVAKSVTTPSPTSGQPTQGPPLPGLIPPAELVELLEPRARAGDSAAACRLAAELVKCRSALQWTTMSEAQISQAVANMGEHGVPEESIERSRHNYESRNLQRRQCEAIPEHLRGQAPWLYLQAAQHGNVQSMVAFAQGAGIGGAEMVANPDLYLSYRENAFHLWRQALQAGSVAAVHAWVEALQSNGFQFLAGALPEEYQDLELAIALKDEIDVAIGSGPGTPTIENLPEITRLRARAMFEQHFAGSEQLASIAQQRPSAEGIKQRLAQSTERTVVISPSEEERVESLNRNCSGL